MTIEAHDMVTRERVSVPNPLSASLAPVTDRGTRREEMLRVLDRAARDPSFIAEVADRGSAALRDYRLTLEDKAALVSGDVRLVAGCMGPLSDRHSTLLNCMLAREAW